ncbi:hypothetical protein Droror1_Dr00007193 [Drosera rotundifolia]
MVLVQREDEESDSPSHRAAPGNHLRLSDCEEEKIRRPRVGNWERLRREAMAMGEIEKRNGREEKRSLTDGELAIGRDRDDEMKGVRLRCAAAAARVKSGERRVN